MSHLNKLKQLRRQYPNDQEFGAKVSEYIGRQIECCDDEANHYTARRLDTHPYGWDVTETMCKVCGKNIKSKVG